VLRHRHHRVLPARHDLQRHEVPQRELVRRPELALLRAQPVGPLRRVQPDGMLPHAPPAELLRRVLLPGHGLPVNAADSEDGFRDAPRVWPRLHHG
jgi:hypothetical protein